MNRAGLVKQLESYQPLDANDMAMRERFLELITKEARCFERDCMAGHFTGSAWVIDPEYGYVLLNNHRKLGKWLHIGGHADGEEDLIEVAIRETEEETGLQNLELLSPDIFDIDAHLIQIKGDPDHYHYDVRYIFAGSSNISPRVSNESVALLWVPLSEVGKYNSHWSMMRMVEKTSRYIGSGKAVANA